MSHFGAESTHTVGCYDSAAVSQNNIKSGFQKFFQTLQEKNIEGKALKLNTPLNQDLPLHSDKSPSLDKSLNERAVSDLASVNHLADLDNVTFEAKRAPTSVQRSKEFDKSRDLTKITD